jgi:hypothetical protein
MTIDFNKDFSMNLLEKYSEELEKFRSILK